jgi:hypothetical protein
MQTTSDSKSLQKEPVIASAAASERIAQLILDAVPSLR